MEVLLDIIHAFDYDILVQIADHWRGGFSDTVWTAISMLGNGGALWIVTALILLFFRKTRRAGAAMLVALLIGLLVGNVLIKEWVMRPRPFVTHPDLTALLDPGDQWSFPSAHTLSSFAAATALFFFPPQVSDPRLSGSRADRFFPPVRQRTLSDRYSGRHTAGNSVRPGCRLADRPGSGPDTYYSPEKGCLNEPI